MSAMLGYAEGELVWLSDKHHGDLQVRVIIQSLDVDAMTATVIPVMRNEGVWSKATVPLEALSKREES